MPLSLSPNRRLPIILPGDASLPDPKPTFYARYQTADQVQELVERYAQAEDQDTHAKFREQMNAILAEKIIAVEHVDADPACLSAVLTEGEMKDLVHAIINGSSLSERDKKKSGLPSALPTDAPVPTAEPPAAA